MYDLLDMIPVSFRKQTAEGCRRKDTKGSMYMYCTLFVQLSYIRWYEKTWARRSSLLVPRKFSSSWYSVRSWNKSKYFLSFLISPQPVDQLRSSLFQNAIFSIQVRSQELDTYSEVNLQFLCLIWLIFTLSFVSMSTVELQKEKLNERLHNQMVAINIVATRMKTFLDLIVFISFC